MVGIISFSNILLKLVVSGKSSPTGLFCVLSFSKSMYYISGFVEKYDSGGLKTMTMWQKKFSNSACASRGFVGLQIKRDGGDLRIESNSHLSAVKVLKLKLNTLT